MFEKVNEFVIFADSQYLLKMKLVLILDVIEFLVIN